jgi:hypothetical protein
MKRSVNCKFQVFCFITSVHFFTSQLLKRFGLNLAPRQKFDGQAGQLKGKAFPLHAMEALWVRGIAAPMVSYRRH